MSVCARIALILVSFSLCAAGVFVADRSAATTPDAMAPDPGLFADAYGRVANGPQREEAFSEFEAVIRRHDKVKSHRGRIEFGSVRMQGSSAVVEVLFFSPDGRMTPYSFTLVPKNRSWKIDSVQRIWFVPRSHLLRGLRV
jgi:hypothetical protein